MRYNPFRPGGVVGPGMFAGRGRELERLEGILFQASRGNPQHFVLQGERGIGKSSLLLFLQLVAAGQFQFTEGQSFKFLVVSVELDPSTTYFSIIQKIASELKKTIAAEHRVKELAKKAWDFLSGWEIFGVKYQARKGCEEREPQLLLEELTNTIEDLLVGIRPEFQGVVFLIDEADKPPASANLGGFVKLFTERLSKRGCNNVVLGLAGLPEILAKLSASHPSSTRVVEVFNLDPLDPPDRLKVVINGLKAAESDSGSPVIATEAAQDLISSLSEGYPHFIQQFSYSAFAADTDNIIDEDDVLAGAFKPKEGAFVQLGQKYFEGLYFEKIWSDEYRKVLRAMAESFENWVDISTIRERTRLRETTLTNALRALKGRRIIIAKEGKRGIYRLPSRSFAVWIRAFTEAVPGSNGVKSS